MQVINCLNIIADSEGVHTYREDEMKEGREEKGKGRIIITILLDIQASVGLLPHNLLLEVKSQQSLPLVDCKIIVVSRATKTGKLHSNYAWSKLRCIQRVGLVC